MNGKEPTERGGTGLLAPRVLFGLVGASLAIALVAETLEDSPGPGPLSRVHDRVPALQHGRACAKCHGATAGAAAMLDACAECHGAVVESITYGSGLHGGVLEARQCARCHREHLGHEHDLAGDAAFRVAGFAARDAYDHAGLGFVLEGVHASLECVSCHSGADDRDPEGPRFLGASQDCTSCHVDAHDGGLGVDCASCHGQVEPFANAAEFVHTTAFPLEGVHSGRACVTCHEPGSPFEIEAYTSHRPASRACASCHDSPHSNEFAHAAGPDCAVCHRTGDPSFSIADAARTRAAHSSSVFVLAGAHAAPDCAACHPVGGTFRARHPGRDPDDCAACHGEPHGRQFTSTPAAACAECHSATTFDEVPFHANADAHGRWPLTGAHAHASCDQCHTREEPGDPIRYRGVARECSACHVDVHGGSFSSHGAAGTTPVDCTRCHDTTSFLRASEAFDHLTWTGFALVGSHANLDCTVCHPSIPGRRLGPTITTAPVPTEVVDLASCAACHSDPHDGRFDGPGHPVEVDGRVGCARCHDESAFGPVPGSRFDHGGWTGFPLEGAHGQTRCDACHLGASRRGAARSFDLVPSRASGASRGCGACHDDPHADAFGDRVPVSIGTRISCARCHDSASFRSIVAFDHSWTGWPLDGLHGDVSCSECHGPNGAGARSAALGKACADCHTDPHGGQFRSRRSDGAAAHPDCARCHSVSLPFVQTTFDHRDSRFALDDVHSALDCAACHRPARTRDDRTFVRYRPLGVRCVDCHGATASRGSAARDR